MVLLMLTATSRSAADTPTADPPADPRADWRVGFSELRGVGLAAENVYLSSTIPRLLRERLTPIRQHTLNAAERRAQARTVLAAARRAAYAELAALLRRRDSAALAGGDSDGESLAAQVVEQRARLDELLALSWQDVEIAERKPLVIVAGVEERGLLPAPRFSPLQAAQEADLDLLVTGRLEQVEGVLFVELQAVSPALGGSAESYRDALRREGLADAVAALQRHLAGLLVGEPWRRRRPAAPCTSTASSPATAASNCPTGRSAATRSRSLRPAMKRCSGRSRWPAPAPPCR